MGRYIMKLTPDEDRYVVWSTVVDAPVFDGTWAEVEKHEIDQAVRRLREDIAQDRKQVDETGTTVRYRYSRNYPLSGSWEDEEIEVVNCPFDNPPDNWTPGTLKRSDLGKWLDTEDNTLIIPRPEL